MQATAAGTQPPLTTEAAVEARAAAAGQPTTEPRLSDRRAPLAEDLYALVVFLHKTFNPDLFAAMGLLELSISQIKLLHQLECCAEEITLKEAAERVRLSLAAASRTIDDLVRRNFILRHEDPDDRRMKRIGLTDEGRSVIRQVNAARLDRLEQFTDTLTEDERARLTQALAPLLAREDIAVCRPEGM